ncbi:MAG: hypothetical protein DMD83_13135 [Candidatus Rokuibacteriota bacterium]|nr:MAG: hypothetical protein DMD83_13135 [Candidatus Rokubacteria bacterium]
MSGGVTAVASAPPQPLLDILAGRGGAALMLGHVHPDGDVLGTLLALGLSLEAAGWSVTYAGPHPIPEVLAFLPGAARWQVWSAPPRAFDVIVLTDCPNPDRTEGLLDGTRGAASRVLNIDHHPDNRGYGTVNWIDPSAAATGEMVFDLIRALGHRVSPEIALRPSTPTPARSATRTPPRGRSVSPPSSPPPERIRPSSPIGSTSAARRRRSGRSARSCAGSASAKTAAWPGSPCREGWPRRRSWRPRIS